MLAVVHDRRHVHAVGTGDRHPGAGEAGAARIDVGVRNHDRGWLERRGDHGSEFVAGHLSFGLRLVSRGLRVIGRGLRGGRHVVGGLQIGCQGCDLLALRAVLRLRGCQRRLHFGQRGLRLLQCGRRQLDLADAGHLERAAAGVLQRAGVADAANGYVGNLPGVRGHEHQLGLRQVDGIRDQLAAAAEYLPDFGGGPARVTQECRVALPVVQDRRDVHRIGAGDGHLRVGEAGAARVDLGVRDCDRGRLECIRHHRFELGLGHVGVRHGHVGARLRVVGHRLRVGSHRLRVGEIRLQSGVVRRKSVIVRVRGRQRRLDLGQGGLCLLQCGRRQLHHANAGDLQRAVAGVGERAGIAGPAYRDVGHLPGVGRHEHQLGLRQVHGVGNQLPCRAVDLLHLGGGAAGVPEQRRVALAVVQD